DGAPGLRDRGADAIAARRFARDDRHDGSPDLSSCLPSPSGQLADAQVAELHRRALGLEAAIAGGRIAAVAARALLTVVPEADVAVDGPDVIVVPLADALAQPLGREAAAAVGRGGREGLHLRGSDGEDVAVSGEEVGLLAGLFLILLGVAMVEDLDLDPS